MGHKKIISMQPTKVLIDKKGRRIEVRRAGSVDKNKYARLTPQEKEMQANIGNANYIPGEKK